MRSKCCTRSKASNAPELDLPRDSSRSFATRAGEAHIVEPPKVVVVQPPSRVTTLAPSTARTLSKGAARVGRWLLLHRDTGVTIGALAQACETSDATAS